MMSKVPQHLIDEAARRGIVPGAVIRCAAGGYEASVLPYSQWTNKGWGENYIFMDPPPCLRPWIYYNGEWATVITPAPAKEEEGLKEGDACECGPAMRAAIIELAKELGAPTYKPSEDPASAKEYPNLGWVGDVISANCSNPGDSKKNWHTPESFIAKMRVTASQPKPIKIDGKTVEFNTGSIKVGCTTIDNATVRAIASKLID
jgi:hypothetical protein